LLIQPEKTAASQFSGGVQTQVRTSGRLQTAVQVRTSGRLEAGDPLEALEGLSTPETGPPSEERRQPNSNGAPSEEKRQPNYNGAMANGHRRRPDTPHTRPRKTAGKDVRQPRFPKKILIPVLIVSLGVAAFLLSPGLGVIAPQVDAQTSISALAALRSQPSKRPGKTVDQCVNEWLEESRDAGNLVSYSGWSFKQIMFDKSKVLLVFSFEEKGGVKTAEWLADVHENSFASKNDLAAQIY